MLSKRMTFSLMSLITLLAFAFVVPSAMAGEFGVSLDTTGDVSSAGDLQLAHPGTSLAVTVKFDQAVVFAATKAFVTTYDIKGKLVDIPAATSAPATASKNIKLTIPVTAAVAKVNIRIAKGITAADPLSADTSAALDVNVFLVAADAAGGPRVYSVERVDNPLLPVTADIVQVIITLSEMPREFKKGNLSITDNATITKEPEALNPSTPADLTVPAGAPKLAGLYDDHERDGTTTASVAFQGIHSRIAADVPMALTDAITAYNAALTAADTVAEGGRPPADAVSLLSDTAVVPGGYKIGIHPPFETYELPASGNIVYLAIGTWDGTAPRAAPDITKSKEAQEKEIKAQIAAVDTALLKRNVDPVQPDPADFPDRTEYTNAVEIYEILQGVHDVYDAEVALYMAYVAAVKAEEKADDEELHRYIEENLGTTPLVGTGRDAMLHPYVVTIAPKYPAGKADIVLKVNAFEDTFVPPNRYIPPDKRVPVADFTEGVDQLTIKVGKETLTALTSGTQLYLPHGEGAMIPGSGFYLLTKNKDGSGIHYSHEKDDENLAHKQTVEQLLFNVRAGGLPNLETFLANGGTIHLVAYDGTAAASAYISEVMWGSDASQDDSSNSQWIEIANATSAAIAVAEKKWALWFYQANATPPASYTGGTIIDTIGTKSATGFWSVAGKGQGGRTNVDPGGADVVAIAPTQPLISMSRVMDTVAGGPADGTMPTSWMASTPPSVNFKLGIEGTRVASPGADRIITPSETASDAAALKAAADKLAAAQKKIDSTGTIPQLGSIYISEIMFAGGGVLPQWIEISNGSRSEEINLSGWTITVDNAAADADVDVGATATFTIPDGTKIAPSEQHDPSGDNTPSTILVVTERGRNNLTGAKASGQVINLSEDNEVELILAGVVTGKYMLLSEMAFMITLAPPEPAATKAPAGETVTAKATRTAAEKKAKAERKDATDMAGNLGADGAAAWVLPMGEVGRSSIIRGHVQVTRGPAAPEMGNMMDSWMLASDTSFAQVTHIRASSYYGAASDVGTPGFRAGGALPVELSHFRPARDKVTGAVVITWSTQSELNNAGFFIKRSQQADGEFKVINAAMVQGAGTTSEKQSYTYNDTTAQPNVVYYYQIEDVSLDGNRQTLTRGIRLKGHVSVAGKLTTLWGDLKTSQ